MKMKKIRVMITGVAGKMGQELVRTVTQQKDMLLVAGCDISQVGKDAGEMCGIDAIGVIIEMDLGVTLREVRPDVVCDFTFGEALRKNLPLYLENRVNMVIGTTGLTPEELKNLEDECKQREIGCLVAPNFAIGAVLMMQFAQKTSQYMERAEIIEFHHPQKKDAPSGTAIKTAEGINEAKDQTYEEKSYELLPGSRGGHLGSVNIHSVRLSGFVASQEVIFGGEGQTLTIRHDSLSRVSFMPGILLAIRKMAKSKQFYYGLDKIMKL